MIPRKSLPAPGSRAPGIADGEEVAIPRGGSITPLPIAADAQAIQAGTPGRLPGTPGRPRGPVQAQHPQPAQDPQQNTEQDDVSIDDSSSESAWNPKASDPNSSQVGKATPHSSDLEDEEPQEVELVDDIMALEDLGARSKPSRPGLCEDVGSPSKIPRAERSIPKAFPGARRVSRYERNDEEDAEYFDDEVMDDPFEEEDVEMVYSESEDEQEFKDEDAGPPDLSEEHVLKKDRKAVKVEMERLEKLGVIKLVPLSELKEQENKGIEWKWLTAKMVFDWRFRQEKWTRRSRLVAREFKQASQRDDVFSPATNTSLLRILPALALHFFRYRRKGKQLVYSLRNTYQSWPEKMRPTRLNFRNKQ